MRNAPANKPEHDPENPITRLSYNHWYRRAFMNSAAMMGEMSLWDALRLLWRARLWLAAGALAGLAGTLLLWGIAVPQYRAELTLAPANPMNGAQFSRLMQEGESFTPLSFLLQKVGSVGTPDFIRFEATARGQAVAAELLEDKAVLTGLERDKAFFWNQPPTHWTPAQLSEYLARRVDIAPAANGSLRRFTYSHPDPRFAAFLLNEIRRKADEAIRLKTRGETLGRIAYLQAELAKVNNPDHSARWPICCWSRNA
ncbi:MAG: hypothetical protein LRY39_00715 [Alphaproteobacteria bacterium]|nr:hypothetical protein [Alphaproteobacteria bacterium]